jgi:shikimate dehydrogenase
VNPAPSAATRLVALLGDPVSHSLSPRFQNAAFRAAGVDGVYLALRCDAAIVAPLLRGIAAAGGAGNVTIPHKAAAAAALDRPATAVQRTGACNTFWYEDGRVCGDNTDVAGIGRALQELAGGEAAGARVLLIGAGGAASAALCALRDAGADEVVVLNRTADRAAALASRYRGETVRIATADDAHALRGERFDIAINATSLGLREDDPLPVGPEADIGFDRALDLVYAPDRTPWVRQLLARSIPAADGVSMLLHQGAAAFERWWGVPAPIGVMRAALSRPACGPVAASPSA